MLKISGKLIRNERAKINAPKDGVHRCGADGMIKGAHSFYINGKFIPHGMVGFYYQLDDDWGLKVFCSPKTGHTRSKDYVRAVRNRMKKYHNIAPAVSGIEKVEVDLAYKDRHYHKTVYALKVQHCQWTDAWAKYTDGHPYDWSADDHKDHSPEGYKKFKKLIDKTLSHETKKELEKIGDSYKLGDVCWDTKTKRWYLVDLG